MKFKQFYLKEGVTKTGHKWFRITDNHGKTIPFIPQIRTGNPKEELQKIVDWLNDLTKLKIPEYIEDRYIQVEYDEMYFITDLKTLERDKKWFEDYYSDDSGEDYSQIIKDEWEDYLISNSMTGDDVEYELNYLNRENYHLKKRIAELEKSLDYKRDYSMPCKVINDFIDYRNEVIKIIDEYLELYYSFKQQGIRPSLQYDHIGLLKQIKKRL